MFNRISERQSNFIIDKPQETGQRDVGQVNRLDIKTENRTFVSHDPPTKITPQKPKPILIGEKQIFPKTEITAKIR